MTISNLFGFVAASRPNQTACYVAGTRMRTTRGDVAIDQLAIGDMLVTTSGAYRPVRWLGHRTIDCTRHKDPAACWPVRIAADAFGAGRPSRDLYVSPGHAICVDVYGETLVPIYSLMNGATIAQAERDVVTYWHVEVDGHELLTAEGLASESYCDVGNRSFFVESGAVGLDAVPDDARDESKCCRPFMIQGAMVDVVRERLRARALALGWHLDDSKPLGGLHLVVDGTAQQPQSEGLVARFAVSADAHDVWLVSETSVPALIWGGPDLRIVGIPLRSIAIDDGLAPARQIAVDDALLGSVFHPPEDGASHRWTMGRAKLPPALWQGCRGTFFLRMELAGPAPARWVAPKPIDASARAVA